jgi:hypothetical protein
LGATYGKILVVMASNDLYFAIKAELAINAMYIGSFVLVRRFKFFYVRWAMYFGVKLHVPIIEHKSLYIR